MAFQDFISGKVSEKAALEAALVRVVAELQAANNAAPAVDDAVNKIKGLISVLQSSPASVVDAAKEAIREACGDISLLPQNKEVSTLTVPRFVVEINSPVLADILGETETESDTNVTVDVVTTASANEILPSSFTSTDNSKDATEESSKLKRRTQAGFNRKVEEWTKKLNNLTTDNYESVIATVDDEFKYWTNGTKFESELISEKLQEAITYWTTLDQPEPEAIIEDNAPEDLTDSNDVVETDNTNVDLSSFDVEETTEDIQIVEEITENTTTEELTDESPVLESVATTIDTTQKFLDRLNTDNLSEAGLSDLQEEIRGFYGSGHIPQPLLDAQITAWERLNNDDDLDDDDAVYSEEFEIDNTPEEPELTKVYDANDDDDDIYDGDIPAEEELTEATDQPTENSEDIAQNKIVTDNLSWQNSILTNCETWEELKEWDKFIANAVNKNPGSVLPETFTALDTTRSKLEARDAQQAKTVDVDSLTQAWVNRAELAFDLEEIQIIYNEIKDEIKASGINPSMALIKALDAANARLTPVTTVVTTKPEISDEDIADAKACINNQWSTPSELTIEVPSTTTKKNPFAGRKSSGGKITVEVELTSSEQTTSGSDSITISSINTSGIFEFQTLDGKPEKHHRFDSRYILDPGTKLFEPSTKYVFEVATWEEVMSLNPLIAENPNKLPLKSLHNPKRNYGKDADKTDVFVIVSDEQADQFVQEYRATLVQMESNPNFEIGS